MTGSQFETVVSESLGAIFLYACGVDLLLFLPRYGKIVLESIEALTGKLVVDILLLEIQMCQHQSVTMLKIVTVNTTM